MTLSDVHYQHWDGRSRGIFCRLSLVVSSKTLPDVVGHACIQTVIRTTQNINNPYFALLLSLDIHDMIYLQ